MAAVVVAVHAAVAVVVNLYALIGWPVVEFVSNLGRAAGGRFLDVVQRVRISTPLLWSSSKRNRRVEVYYYLDHGMPKTNLLR